MQYLGTSDASHNLKNDVKLEGKKLTTTIGTGERTQISIDYGQKNPRIFVSDFLNKQEGSYQVGLHHLKSTNISIASEEQLFEKALETVQANAETFKKSAKNLSEYQTLMSKAIYEQQMKLFEGKLGEKALATEIMKQQINKNIYSQKSIDVLQKLLNLDGGNTLLPNIFNEDTASQPILDFIQRVDVFLEYATPTQCQLRNQNLDQLMLIIQSTQDTTSVTFTSNKSELFSNVTLCTQMMKNTQYLLKNKQENQNSPTPTLNLFSVLFTHCLPSSLTPTRTEISEGIQRFSDFITYNKNGNFNNKPSLAPIITAWDKHTATPL
ncbi:MAG: hypothetical protein LBD75_02240 [Candidatus Peribacteria bacterium]|jgi:hypothetical protein|nr:hypothetical protein [Candidatus Peribacteria bacterium]